jgi:ribosomal-protein-alanine N-acetyltransferase
MPNFDTLRLPVPEQLMTDRLVLSRLKYEEAEELFYTYSSKPEATRYMSWPTHQRISDTREFLKYAANGWYTGADYSFSIRLKATRRLIGSCGIMHDNGKIQFGYILSPTQWGNGYATEVCRKLMQTLKELPGVVKVSTFVDAENTASAKVLLKAGLVEEARLEKYFKFVNQNNRPKDCLLFNLPLC